MSYLGHFSALLTYKTFPYYLSFAIGSEKDGRDLVLYDLINLHVKVRYNSCILKILAGSSSHSLDSNWKHSVSEVTILRGALHNFQL